MFIFGVTYLLIMAAWPVMAIQAFLAVLEYCPSTPVAGVLVPWALLPHTRFLAEKAIAGAVVSAGIELIVLELIIGVANRANRANRVLASIHFPGPEDPSAQGPQPRRLTCLRRMMSCWGTIRRYFPWMSLAHRAIRRRRRRAAWRNGCPRGPPPCPPPQITPKLP